MAAAAAGLCAWLPQVFSIVIWLEQQYYVYMYVVIALSVIAILQSAFQEYQNLKALERLAKADGVINKSVNTQASERVVFRLVLKAALASICMWCGGSGSG